nr:MAG TPA: hypothetical protein [Bacteriophage sp.]
MLILIIFSFFREYIYRWFPSNISYKGVGYYFNETRKFINLCL